MTTPRSGREHAATRPSADVPRFDLDDNIIRLLLLSFRVSERCLRARANEHGFGDVRMSHLPVLRAISHGVTRLTDIADGAGITRQTAGALAGELETLGYIRREPDPGDKRAKMVQFTQRGKAFIRDFAAILQLAEEDLVGMIGSEDLDHLSQTLRVIVDRGQESGPIS